MSNGYWVLSGILAFVIVFIYAYRTEAGPPSYGQAILLIIASVIFGPIFLFFILMVLIFESDFLNKPIPWPKSGGKDD